MNSKNLQEQITMLRLQAEAVIQMCYEVGNQLDGVVVGSIGGAKKKKLLSDEERLRLRNMVQSKILRKTKTEF